MRLLVSNLLHDLAHRLTPRQWPCECEVRAYTRSWRHAHDAQERRARLLRSGVSVESANRFEEWIRRNAA
jgi:hypothetical protein